MNYDRILTLELEKSICLLWNTSFYKVDKKIDLKLFFFKKSFYFHDKKLIKISI